MINWLKKHFIPHEGNNHRPHALHAHNVRKVVVLVLFLELILFVAPRLSLVTSDKFNMAAVFPAVVGEITNSNRQEASLPVLRESVLLNQAAELKAQDMSTRGYFAHNSPDGKTPWYWLDQVGYEYVYAGENLALNYSDSKDVVDAWMNSPTHRDNLLKKGYTEMGTGLATGQFEGREAIFVVQLYASPRATASDPDRITTQPTVEMSKGLASTQGGDVLGESITQVPVEKISLVDRVMTSPHQNTNRILFIILGFVLLVLILNLVIKFKVQHLDLITNGLLLVAIVLALYLANNYMSTKDVMIKTGTDTSVMATTPTEKSRVY